MNTEAVLLSLAITSVLCAVGLLTVLLWPSKRKVVVKPWQDESHPDIRLFQFQMTEWREGRRSAPPSLVTVNRAKSAENRRVLNGY